MWLDFEPRCAFKNLLKSPFDFPILTPKLSLLQFQHLNHLLLLILLNLRERSNLLINPLPININLILKTIEFTIPTPSNISFLNNTLKGILSQFLISFFIFITVYCSSHASFEVFNIVGHEIETVAFFLFDVVFEYWVFKTTSSESDDWGAAAEELVLYDSSRFEEWWHHWEVTSNINQGAISKESIWITPYTKRVLIRKIFHPFCTILPIFLFWVRWPTN